MTPSASGRSCSPVRRTLRAAGRPDRGGGHLASEQNGMSVLGRGRDTSRPLSVSALPRLAGIAC